MHPFHKNKKGKNFSGRDRSERSGKNPSEKNKKFAFKKGQKNKSEKSSFQKDQKPGNKFERGENSQRPPRDAFRNKKWEKQARPQKVVLYGHHAVIAAFQNPRRRIDTFYCTENTKHFLSENALRLPEGAIHKTIDRFSFDSLLGEGAVHQGVAVSCQPLQPPPFDQILRKANRLVMLDQVTDPHNVGAILRSCAAFGIDAVIVQDRHSPFETGVLAKSASGALELVPMVPVTNLSRALIQAKESGFTLYGLDEAGSALGTHPLAAKWVLVFGAEGPGIRRLVAETCDHLISLPTHPNMPSLNVSNAVAVSLFAFTGSA